MSQDVFRWVIAVAVFLACIAAVWQAVMLTAIYRAGKETQKAGKEATNKLGPLVDHFEALLAAFNSFLNTAGQMLEENRPRIADITAETLIVAKTARQQAERIGELIDDANERAKARIAQIDQTVGHAVDQVEHAG